MARELLAKGRARRSKLAVHLERDGEGVFHVVLRGPGEWNEYRDHDFTFSDETDAFEVYGNFLEDRELTPEEEARWNDVFILAGAVLEQMSENTPAPPPLEVVDRWEAPDGHRAAMLVKRRQWNDRWWWGVDVAHRNTLGVLIWHPDPRGLTERAARDEFRRVVAARI